jgi:predicted NBD/HSP70 family sugar kinase
MSAGRRFLGIDLGGTKILGAVHGDSTEPIALEQVPTRRDEGGPALADEPLHQHATGAERPVNEMGGDA